MTFLRALLAGCLALGLAATAAAHQLNVFAFVEEGDVVVEAKFSNGKRPVSGEVRVRGGDGTLLLTLPLGENGEARFALSSVEHEEGLAIDVSTGAGHDDYWILTPEDIAAKAGG